MILRLSFIFLVGITLCACEAIKSKEQANRLDITLQDYEKALRWAEYRAVASYHVSREKTPLVVDIEHAKNFSVTGINILEKTINPEVTEAVILAEISYYSKEYGTVKTLRQEQHWWRVPEGKAWLIESDFPEFE
jgi:hypothetical protein